MKRRMVMIIACVLVAICIGGACWMNCNNSTMIGQKVIDIRKNFKKNIVLDTNCLLVLKSLNGRIICTTNNETVVAEIRYDKSGAIVLENGISPLKASLFDTNFPKTVQDMMNIFGNPHADVGSGAYLPTYILDDGRIVTYRTNSNNLVNNTVKSIFEM